MTTKGSKTLAVAVGLLAAAAALNGTLLASCASTPTNVPVQTFEQPQNMSVVCMQVGQLGQLPNFVPLTPAVPQPQAACAQVPAGVTGAILPYHLFALVTQETRGEVAVVDLTAGGVVDIDPGTPGINFLPVGRLPSDIASTPDGRMTFVGSGDPTKPAIFAMPSKLILGDSQYFDGGEVTPGPGPIVPSLTTWPVCALPQVPGAVRVLPSTLIPSLADGGAAPTSGAGYVLVVVFPGDSTSSAKVAIIDPAPLLRGGEEYQDGGLDAGTTDLPGEVAFSPCTILGYAPLAAPASGATWAPGPAWDDGVKWVDAAVDGDVPQAATSCASPADAGSAPAGSLPLVPTSATFGTTPSAGAAVLDTGGPRPTLYVADTALPMIHVFDVSDPIAPVELSPLYATSIADTTRVISIGQIAVSPPTREYKRFLYAIDRTEGSILVYDVTDPVNGPRLPLTRPHPELDPFQPPDRILFGTPVASVAFVQHDWPLESKYDSAGNQVTLYTAETGLLCNPNPNVDTATAQSVALTAQEYGPFSDDGAYYRNANVNTGEEVVLGPYRLRGVFAFATLSNGLVVTIDVDDWDAPCRRPDPLAPLGGVYVSSPAYSPNSSLGLAPGSNPLLDALVDGMYSSIAPPQPWPSSAADGDPYHTPVAFTTVPHGGYTDSPVTQEWFAPVSAPHRARSAFLLENNATNGDHAPYLLSVPQLAASGSPLATQGSSAVGNPSMVPTSSPYIDPSVFSNEPQPDIIGLTPSFTVGDAGVFTSNPMLAQSLPLATPGVRFAYEDPEVQVDQDWAVTYEGPLPGFFDSQANPLVTANLCPVLADGGLDCAPDGGGPVPDSEYQTLALAVGSSFFCSKGVEDWAVGQQRGAAEYAAIAATIPTASTEADAGSPTYAQTTNFVQQVDDYIQLTDNILPATDQYWTVNNSCWSDDPSESTPAARNNLCNDTYGQTLDPTTPSLQRDFPIVEAYDDHLVIGRFAYANGQTTPREPGSSSWAVVGSDPSNPPFLRLMQCCFHNSAHFNVRTGGQWSATSSVNGFLHHIIASGTNGRCVPSCEARDALLNGRAAPIPRPVASAGSMPVPCTPSSIPAITRDSVLAMRNPFFSFMIWNGQSLTPDAAGNCTDNPPVRDVAWTFSTRGQFSPLSINLAATSSGVSPQTMQYIDSLGQLAIIDGASQGLILIDLETVAEAHAPYF